MRRLLRSFRQSCRSPQIEILPWRKTVWRSISGTSWPATSWSHSTIPGKTLCRRKPIWSFSSRSACLAMTSGLCPRPRRSFSLVRAMEKELDPNQYHHFKKWNAPNKVSEAARSWLGIAPQFHLGSAANKDKNPGSLGFYFLLLMGHIVYGHI